jgi:diketogulonate reductase-like aldo/keto reductase
MDFNTRVKLNNGVKMPIVGLGTWNSSEGKECENAVAEAINVGYRHIDTASVYGNERSVGKGVKKSGVSRKEIFITTKLWNGDHDDPEGALEESLEKLQLDYVDLYLIHWPVPQRNKTWKVFEKFLEEGKCRAIGVSNFMVKHLEELLKQSKTVPVVNQVEFTPYVFNGKLLEYCKSKKIQLESYSPLTQGIKFKDSKLVAISDKYNKTPAQILLRWNVQHGNVVIPKSTSKERMTENSSIFDFELSEEDMKKLDGFDEGFRVCPDPNRMT